MLISTSKTGSSQIAESVENALAVHPIDPDVAQRMDQMYQGGKNRALFEQVGRFAAATVARIYLAYNVIGFIVENAAEFEDALEADDGEFARRIGTMVGGEVAKIDALYNAPKLIRDVKTLLASNMSSRDSAIIEGSERFPGGHDIIMSGTPASSTPAAAMGNFNLLNEQGGNRPRLDNDEQFQDKNIRVYQAEIAQNAIRAANQLHESIFGEPRRGGQALFYCRMVRVNLDFDWSALNNILYAIHPSLSSQDLNIFQNMDKKVTDVLAPFMQLGVRSVPGRNLLDRKMQALRVSKDQPVEINPVNLAVDVRAEAGIIVNLEKPIVEYICQGATDLTAMCVYRWFQGWAEYYLRVQGTSRASGSVTRRAAIPRYVTSATTLPKMKALREKFGYSVHESLADDRGLTIMPNGTMACLPKRDDIDPATVTKYEHDLNRVLETLFARGIPLSTDHDTLRTAVFAARENDLDIDQKMQTEAKSLSKYGNICIGIDPDFSVLVSTSSSGGISVNATRTVGAKIPTALDTADMLGYDFAEPGESPNFRNLPTVIESIAKSYSPKFQAAEDLKLAAARAEASNGKFILSANDKQIEYANGEGTDQLYSIIAHVCATYGHMVKTKQAPDVKTLVQQAREELGFTGDDASLTDSSYDNNLYQGLIENNFDVNDQMPPELLLLRTITRVLNDASGLRGSNLITTLMQEMGSITAATEAMQDHTHFFQMSKNGKLSDLARLNNYFGGSLFRQMCAALKNGDRKKLFSSLAEDAAAPTSDRLIHMILPFATMYSDVIPSSMEVFEQAENEVERLKPDQGISIEDIRVPGLKEGAALMPHQLGAHQTLRRRPRYATIFIAPGGGKTIIGLTDIMAMMKELDELGEPNIRPLIVCPTNLVANWCDDLHKIADGWNAIPITSDTVNTWGEERLYDVISQAPQNTIFVAGLSFLQTGVLNVDIGGVRVRIRGAVEFVNRFNFSYVIIDESHKVKNYSGGQSGSQVHFNAKAIFTAPSVRYARIATGTLVTDRVSDIVGQAALLTPAIFGDNLDITDQGDGTLAMIRRAHSRLSNHTAFIAYKRKSWAFMLPNPIDTFLNVDIDSAKVPYSDLHKQTYDAMYQELLDLLDQAAADAKKKAGGGDEDDEEGTGDGGESEDESGIDPNDLDTSEDGDVLGALLASNADLNLYFQRMEQMLTDPMGDDIARETFEQAGVKEFTSVKVLTVVERIRKHFEVQKERDTDPETGNEQQTYDWSPGVVPKEYDIAVYQGRKFMARKQTDGYRRNMLPPSMTPPPEDPEYWKEEVQGKLIVFTRYTRSANAVYNALPEQYKRVAVLFHGEVGKLGQDKVANLDAFKTNPDVQILIANEQAISEGHNMQMGSRIIRVDTPWSPGVYDQSTARIFRPDVAAAQIDENGKAGDMKRELVFIDWIMTNRTLEVGKVARLMWKTLEKTQFDEKGNERYADLDKYELPPIKMNKNLLINANTMEDFIDYFLAKRDLNEIETAEFAEMRKTTVAAMLPLTPEPALRNFRVLDQFPIVANQKIPDRNNWGLVRLLDWARGQNFGDGETLKNSVHRMPVVTEFGNGIIVGVNVRNVDGKLKSDSPISTVRVRLAGSEELVTIPATKIHCAMKVGKRDLDTFFKVRKPWATEQDRKRANAEANRIEVEESIQDETATVNTTETRKKVIKVERETARAKKRAENVAQKKPVNEGVKEAAKRVRRVETLPELNNTIKPAAKAVRVGTKAVSLEDLSGADMSLEITPTVYNGFVALYADSADADAKSMKQFEFVEFGDYVFIDLYYYEDFERFLDYIEITKKLEFDGPSSKRLEFIQDMFTGKRLTFDTQIATHMQSSLKQFFLIRHKAANDKAHVKCYPMVMQDRMRIMFDLATNPKMARIAGQKIPNMRKFGTFEKSSGMWIGFVKNVATAKARLTKIMKAGYKVTNFKRCIAALEKLKLTQSKSTDV
ncbi:putative ATP-dependent DNA helicase [Erwinia phage vB_EamM_Yoloswag]|uniref:Putative ATP-dependent DNA helicase n=1 Tax=Erwinia phage vB_EamM_Yoloswag TaxID=1958956 RepID=A0A1S6L394_9CAUD|nr:DNA helicase [Erwinia phage vB_EamM_Yoloswag]AQT28650.1 putative ATP-dependent DNA helicase [Erwinia phage vB_EamM_Yoloswag]